MTASYSKEELWKIYLTLPEELREALFSIENSDHIDAIANRYDVTDSSRITSLVGLTLLGLLAPKEFEAALAQEPGIKKTDTPSIARETERLIFYPVRPFLERLYEQHLNQPSAAMLNSAPQIQEEAMQEQLKSRPKSTTPDPYRETFEQP